MIEMALAYVARGWPVFPCWWPLASGRCACGARHCGDQGKHPLGRLVPRGVTQATTDTALVRRWWDAYPRANVAIATGPAAGLLVLDVDERAGGGDALAELERTHGPLPDMVRVQTGNGMHVYFTHPSEPVANRVGIRPGLDVRGAGGYVIAPPSIHISGKHYLFEIGHEPETMALAPPPPWLLALVREDRRRLTFDGTPLVIPAGQRNDRLFALACTLRRYGLGVPAITGCLGAINAHHVQPPLDNDELRRIAASAGRYRPGDAEDDATDQAPARRAGGWR